MSKPRLTKQEAEIAERMKTELCPWSLLTEIEREVLRKVKCQVATYIGTWWTGKAPDKGEGRYCTYRVAPDAEWDVIEDEPEYLVTECAKKECRSPASDQFFGCSINNAPFADYSKWQFDGYIYGEVGGDGDYLGRCKQYQKYAPRHYRTSPCIVNDKGEIEYPVAVRWRKVRGR